MKKTRIMKFASIMLTVFMVLGIVNINSQIVKAANPSMENALEWAVNIANDQSHGYSQQNRDGNPDYDCSSLVYYALKNSGFTLKNSKGKVSTSAFTTSIMSEWLTNSGFTYITMSSLGSAANVQRGDILWRSGHTEMYLGGGKQVGAHGNQPQDYSPNRSPAKGDQADEISVANFKFSSWTGVFRYNGGYVPPTPELVTPTITTNKTSYEVGDTVNISWAASPAGSNLSHYWLTINAPNGATIVNQTMNKNTSYSFSVSQSGNYMITAYATPKGSLNGEGSLTSVKTISVQVPYFEIVHIPYIIKFDSNGGEECLPKIIKYGEILNIDGPLYTPRREGYTFDGWYTELEGGTKITSGYKYERQGDMTLYAHWTANKYMVSFADEEGNIFDSKEVTYGSKYGKLPSVYVALGSNLTFEGWYTEPDGGSRITEDTIVTITSDQVLYPHWLTFIFPCKIYFDPNGGVGQKISFDAKYGDILKLDDIIPEREGYTFDGWYTESEGGTKITSGYMVKGNMTLYAHWKVEIYTIKFHVDNDVPCSALCTYGNAFGELPNVHELGDGYGRYTENGYKFAGWYTEPVGGIEFTSDTIITGPLDLYAQWEKTDINNDDNNNDTVTMFYISLLQKHLTQRIDFLNTEQLKLMDVNKDSRVNIFDLNLLKESLKQ